MFHADDIDGRAFIAVRRYVDAMWRTWQRGGKFEDFRRPRTAARAQLAAELTYANNLYAGRFAVRFSLFR
jgi:hypothetical protein